MRTITEITLKPSDREAIVAATMLLKERFPVTRVTLFGSKATGRGQRRVGHRSSGPYLKET